MSLRTDERTKPPLNWSAWPSAAVKRTPPPAMPHTKPATCEFHLSALLWSLRPQMGPLQHAAQFVEVETPGTMHGALDAWPGAGQVGRALHGKVCRLQGGGERVVVRNARRRIPRTVACHATCAGGQVTMDRRPQTAAA